MFLPIRTDRRLQATPWVNYALIAVNALIFLWQRENIANAGAAVQSLGLGQAGYSFEDVLRRFPVISYYMRPQDPQLFQFLSYQFLHADPIHLIGNMVFLFIFGNGVEDRLGRVGYLLFYLAGGVLAGVGHLLGSEAPVLGASGAVAAVTGAYLVLFPLSNVTIVYWFWIIGTFEVSSMVLILFRVGQDALFQILDVGNVAYLAHLAGYGFGIAVGMGLLLLRLLPREPYDLLALIEQRRRREQFRKLTRRDGYQPWTGRGPGAAEAVAEAGPASAQEQALMQRRAGIAAALAGHDLPAAARRYVELVENHPGQVMSQRQQLDIANQLMAEGWHAQAAAAYRLFLETYPTAPDRPHVQLILAVLLGRYLHEPAEASGLLTEAMPRLDGDDRQLAESLLAEVGGPEHRPD